MFYVFDIGIAATLTNLISEAYSGETTRNWRAGISLPRFGWSLVFALYVGVAGCFAWRHVNWATFLNTTDGTVSREAPMAVLVAFLVFLIALPAGLVIKVLGGYQEMHAANLFTASGSLLSLFSVIIAIRLHCHLPVLVAAFAASVPAAHLACLLWLCWFHKPWLKPWPAE